MNASWRMSRHKLQMQAGSCPRFLAHRHIMGFDGETTRQVCLPASNPRQIGGQVWQVISSLLKTARRNFPMIGELEQWNFQ